MVNHRSQCLEAPSRFSGSSPCSSRAPEFNDAETEPRVLLVDDDPDIVPLVEKALMPYRLQTEVVAGGVDAIMRLRERSYDLVILDLGLADVHGLDVLRTLRELPLNENVPVLILTANGSDDAIVQSFGDGADEFVRKPFNPRELGMRALHLMRPFEY